MAQPMGLSIVIKECEMQNRLSGVFPLVGVPQNYAWGGHEYLNELFQLDQADKVIAEYWIGTHHRGPSKVKIGNDWKGLDTYDKLPYLLKILDVNGMLSIQSHPNKEQALIGFEAENNASIPLDAKHRIFKDDNHKPELMVALGDFWLLHGFKSEDDIKSILQNVVGLSSLETYLSEGIKNLFEHVMGLDESELHELLNPLKKYLDESNFVDKNHPDYWAKKAFEDYGFDSGIFGIYFFNLVYLSKWEGIYQEAGIPHAYLEGRNIELMANSDNVFRAGLTPKHIDVSVLLSHLDFSPVVPLVIKPESLNEFDNFYPSPADEFELHLIRLEESDYTMKTQNEECFIVLKGEFDLVSDNSLVRYKKGQSIYASINQNLIFKPLDSCIIVRAV